MALRAGEHILITASSGSDTITVSRYEVDKPDQRQQVSRNIADVIRAVTEMGASYPDVAQMLVQADHQQNMPGALEIDALPKAGRTYFRPDPNDPTKRGRRARIGNSGLVPNLFDGDQNQTNMESAVDGSWDAPPRQSEPGDGEDDRENRRMEDEQEIAPQDDVLKDPRKWYDPRRLLRSHDFTKREEKSDTTDGSE